MWDLGALRDRGDFARRLVVTAVALIVYRLAAYIPLPGLDAHALAPLYGADGEPSNAFPSWRSGLSACRRSHPGRAGEALRSCD